MNTVTKVWRCPVCGSDNVEQLMLTWVSPNTMKSDEDYYKADMYNDRYYCNTCDGHVSHLELTYE